MDVGSILSQIMQAALLPIALAGLALIFPYRKSAVMRPLTPEEIKAVQKSAQVKTLVGLLPWFAIIGLLSWLSYDFLKTLHHLLPKPSKTFSHVFPYDDTFWMLPAVCFGFGATTALTARLGRLYYGAVRYNLLNHAYNQQYGIDGDAVMRWMTGLFVGAGVVAMALCYTTYAGVQGKKVVINPLLEIRERRYPFDQLTQLTYVDYRVTYQNKKEDQLPYYEMTFRDGFVWDTREFGRNIPLEHDRPIFEYLSQQTGIRIDSTERVKQIKP